MARDLYKKAVRVEEGAADKEAVSFDSFVGVSPRRYIDFFEMQGERKDHRGQAVDWNKAKSRPRFERLVETYLFVERKIVEALDELLPDKLNFNKPREHQ